MENALPPFILWIITIYLNKTKCLIFEFSLHLNCINSFSLLTDMMLG